MGKSRIIPKVFQVDGKPYGEWQIKYQGRPTPQNLETAVYALMDSFNKKDGVNRHIVEASGVLFTPSNALIYDQINNRVLASWTAPTFMVID